jgi:hypothetical protein
MQGTSAALLSGRSRNVLIMTEKTSWESIKAEGGAILDRLKEIVRQGNVRRVRIRQGGRIVAEFPLTAGVVGAVFAPMLAAVGAIVALAKDCTLEVERPSEPGETVVVTDSGRASA